MLYNFNFIRNTKAIHFKNLAFFFDFFLLALFFLTIFDFIKKKSKIAKKKKWLLQHVEATLITEKNQILVFF